MKNAPNEDEASTSTLPSLPPLSTLSSSMNASTTDDSKSNNILRNDDFAFDGMWPFTGFGGMMVTLAEDYVKSKQELTEIETTRHPSLGNDDNDGNDDEENVVVLKDIDPTANDGLEILLLQKRLNERGLHMADGVLRRLLEGCCPPRIQITRLHEETTMPKLISLKEEGNQHFVEKGYREALDCYNAALESIPSHQRDRLHVAPTHQIAQVVNLLSNKAECLLRKAKYEDAAEACTEALILDQAHQKSRLRRAKAGLEIGMYDRYEATSRGDGSMTGVAYLVQAQHDLQELLRDDAPGGRKAAQKVAAKLDKLLAGAKKKVLGKDPDAQVDWDMTILKIQSRCW